MQLPVLSTGVVDKALDFTVMMWFKIDMELPQGQENEIMYLFQFTDGVACYITSKLSILCDTQDRRKIQAYSEDLKRGKWYHVTLSSSKEKTVLILQDNLRIIAMQEDDNF